MAVSLRWQESLPIVNNTDANLDAGASGTARQNVLRDAAGALLNRPGFDDCSDVPRV
jgi:hypothetical protein